MPEANHQVRVVSFQIFVWAIGLILLIFGVGFNTINAISNRAEKTTETIGAVKEDISSIRTDISWIRTSLIEMKNQSQIKK